MSKPIVKKGNIVEKNVVQAVVILDTFKDEFRPISDDLPIALLPFIDRPLIEYTLESLCLAGVEETFLFCCSHIEVVKSYIQKCVREMKLWSLTMKVEIIGSETCCSFGDCMRDIDAKGILRGDFILVEPGVISNLKVVPILEDHVKTAKIDKGAAMTVIFQESAVDRSGVQPQNKLFMGTNTENKIVHYQKMAVSSVEKITVPLDRFIENNLINMYSNLRDTGVSICSPSVLPLFADNFDFQTKDDFIRGLLMNEEILESSVYCHLTEDTEFGCPVTSWRLYQTLIWELTKFWTFPISCSKHLVRHLKDSVIVNAKTNIPKSCSVKKSVIGENVLIGENVKIENSFIFSNSTIGNNVSISTSVVGHNCVIQKNCILGPNTVLGKEVIIDSDNEVVGKLVMSRDNDSDEFEKLGESAFVILEDCEQDETETSKRLCDGTPPEYVWDDFTESEEEDLSRADSSEPEDTKLFFSEVIDSLTRGFEDKLDCHNLILEINSSRYAYNVTVSEVNFSVVKAILIMSLVNQDSEKDVQYLVKLSNYFFKLISNYIRNRKAMDDCLKAIEDVATTQENITDRWVICVLKWFYDKEQVSEEAILDWYNKLNEKSKLRMQVKPFASWLKEAEESSSSEDESEE